MSIGRGWYEENEEPENFKKFKARQDVAVSLLKEKLDYVFKMIANNPHKDKMAPKGRYVAT